jgi:hypothetical protein
VQFKRLREDREVVERSRYTRVKMSSTADPPRPSAEGLGSLLEFQTLVSELSSRFINLPPGDVVGRE